MTLVATLLMAAVATEPGDVRAAVADRATLPIEDHASTFYLSYSSAEAGRPRDELRTATRLMVASTSRQPILERCAPHPITDTLARIDLRDLLWEREAFDKLCKPYPYHRYGEVGTPLVLRADWLLLQLADANESAAYYELLLGEAPATRDGWLKLLGVEKEGDPLLRFGMIEEQSGVAKQRVRWLESFPTTSGYAWGTRDSLEITPDNDPLEHPEGDFQHDGEEWIVGIPKVSVATGDRGVLQVYLLASGDGKRVDKAPIDLVEDSTRFRGLAEIRNPGSCIQCHGKGLNEPTRNGLRDYVLSGAGIYARDKETQARLEAFHLGKLDRTIGRANEDFGVMVELLTGQPAEDAAGCFRRAVERYDAPLAIEDVARELGVLPDTARNALAKQTGLGRPLGARAAGLAHERTIPREAFEERFADFRRIQDEWND